MTSLPCPSYKVVILGESSVGKTSLVHRFTTNEFNTQLANTIGAAFITKDYSHGDKKLRFEIWDTAGQERYRSLTPMYYRNSKVALVCYDLTDIENSLSKGKYWIEQLKLNNDTDGESPIKIVLVGTKADLIECRNNVAVSEFLSDEKDIGHFITSSKTGDGISDIFDMVIDEIPQSFFTDHYKRLEEEEENSKSQGIFLNNQFSGTNSKCC